MDAVLVEPVVDLAGEPVEVDPASRRVGHVRRSVAARARFAIVHAWTSIRFRRAAFDLPSSPLRGRVSLPLGSGMLDRGDRSNCTDEPPRVHHPSGSSACLTRSARAQSGAGLAPDAEPFLPVGRAAREDQVAAVADGLGAEAGRSRRPGLQVGRSPSAWPRTIPLPAWAWTAQRPGSRSSTNAATDAAAGWPRS